jgi:hypothetical protein
VRRAPTWRATSSGIENRPRHRAASPQSPFQGDPGISNMTQVLTGLIDNGEFTQILQRLDG